MSVFDELIQMSISEGNSDPDSDDILDLAERKLKITSGLRRTKRDLLLHLSKDSTKREFYNASNRLAFKKSYASLVSGLNNVNNTNYREEVKSLNKNLDEAQKTYRASLQAMEVVDPRFKARITNIERAAQRAGLTVPAQLFQTFVQPIEGDVPVNDPSSSSFPASFRHMMKLVNAQAGPGAEYFKLDVDNQLIGEPTDEELRQLGLGQTEINTLRPIIEDYKREHGAQLAAKQAGLDGMAAARDSIGKLEAGNLSNNELSQAIEGAKNVLESVPEILSDSAMTVAQAESKIRANTQIQNEVDDIDAEIKRLGGSSAGKQAVSNFAYAMADPSFRAWAIDHGFDNLTSVPLNEDGTPDYGAYAPGGDDLSAKAAYERQYRRGPNKYGFKKITSGEIVQVTLANGNRIVGDRLKRHAADPKGTIRVVTEDGKITKLSPSDMKQVVVIDRDETKMTPLERRASRVARRRGEDYTAAAAQAMTGDPESMIGTAMTESGKYVMDDSGKYIKQELLDEKKDEYIQDQGTTAYISGDMHFIEDQSTGKMYEVGPGGSLTLLDENDTKDADGDGMPDRDSGIAKIALARSERPRRLTVTRDGKQVPITKDLFAEMIKSNQLDSSLQAESFSNEESYNPAKAEKLDSSYKEYRSSITPEDIGFMSSEDRPDPFSNQQLDKIRDIYGVEFADLVKTSDEATEVPSEVSVDPTEAEAQFSEKELRTERMLQAAADRMGDVDLKLNDEGEEEYAAALSQVIGEPAGPQEPAEDEPAVSPGTGAKVAATLKPTTDDAAKTQMEEATKMSAKETRKANRQSKRQARRRKLMSALGGPPKGESEVKDDVASGVRDVDVTLGSGTSLADILRGRRGNKGKPANDVSGEAKPPQTSPIAPGKGEKIDVPEDLNV